jgi:hypothetical protein
MDGQLTSAKMGMMTSHNVVYVDLIAVVNFPPLHSTTVAQPDCYIVYVAHSISRVCFLHRLHSCAM